MNISIFASVGCQNLGDELILKNEVALLRKEFGSDSIFKIASYDPLNATFDLEGVEYFEYFPFGAKKLRNMFRNIRNCITFFKVILWSDIVVIGGGGIIYDTEKQSVGDPLNQWIFRTKVARFFRKKIYFYALGVDIKKEENTQKLQKIFHGAYKITVRDALSQKQLQDIGIDAELVDDPVMSDIGTSHSQSFPSNGRKEGETIYSSLETKGRCPKDRGDIIKYFNSQSFHIKNLEGINFKNKTVGLALRSGYLGKTQNPKIEVLLINEICNYIEGQGGKIVFLPHSFHASDSIANDHNFLQNFMKEGREICNDMQQVYSFYTDESSGGNDKIIVSMRLHSMILAHVYSIPQIAISYSQKTDEFLKRIS